MFLYRGLPLSFKARCLPQIEACLCLAICDVVAQTQGYYLVCIWGSRGKFQGGGAVLRTICLVLECGFAEFLYTGAYVSLKLRHLG